MEENQPLVSVCMITYNHEDFIKQAIEGVLMQQTDFNIQFIISNDSSNDNTHHIINELIASNFNQNIKILYFNQAKNLGMMPNFKFALEKCTGKYIALCEGDDYWTDPLKLNRQIDFLFKNDEYIMSTENSYLLNSKTLETTLFNNINDCDISVIQLLNRRQFTTASVLFRSTVINQFLKLKYIGDIVLWCFIAKKGKIKYCDKISSVYRRGSHGIVESSESYKWSLLMEKWNKEIKNLYPNNLQINKTIKKRNHSHFYNSFIFNFKIKNYKKAFLAIFKCFRIDIVFTYTTLKQSIYNYKK